MWCKQITWSVGRFIWHVTWALLSSLFMWSLHSLSEEQSHLIDLCPGPSMRQTICTSSAAVVQVRAGNQLAPVPYFACVENRIPSTTICAKYGHITSPIILGKLNTSLWFMEVVFIADGFMCKSLLFICSLLWRRNLSASSLEWELCCGCRMWEDVLYQSLFSYFLLFQCKEFR